MQYKDPSAYRILPNLGVRNREGLVTSLVELASSRLRAYACDGLGPGSGIIPLSPFTNFFYH